MHLKKSWKRIFLMESLHWKFFKAVTQPGLFFGFKSQIAMKKYKVNLIGTTKLNFSTSLSHARGNAQVSYQSLFCYIANTINSVPSILKAASWKVTCRVEHHWIQCMAFAKSLSCKRASMALLFHQGTAVLVYLVIIRLCAYKPVLSQCYHCTK